MTQCVFCCKYLGKILKNNDTVLKKKKCIYLFVLMIKIVKLPNSKLRNPQNLWNMDVYKYVMKLKNNLFVINLHDNLHHPQTSDI